MMDLHNSAMYNGKAILAERDVDKTTPFLLQVEDGLSLSSTSMKELKVSPGNVNSWTKEYKGKEAAGLKPNVPKGSENMSSAGNSVPSNTAKRTRVSHQSLQTSRCQVEGCNLNLSSAKDYHRRHRICEYHSKSPKVIVAGLERRFCQQCSRFHHLAEFDDKKRSCRRRLSDHNARRRRPQPEAMHLSSMGMTSSSLYDRRPPSLVLNRLASSLSNASWESSSCSLKMTHAGNSLMRVSGSIASAAANSYTNEAPKLPRALSLLSTTTTSWGFNESESTPLDQVMQGTVSMAQPVMPWESQNWPLIPAQHVWAEHAPSISPLQ